jgi:outer membrane protein assembly factor BamA
MSDDRYLFAIYNTAQFQSEFLKNINVARSRINMKSRTNYAYGIFHYSGRRYDIRESDDFFYERSFGGFFTLIYPLSTFKRLEANITIANSDKEFDFSFSPRKSLLLSNTFSFVHDNTLWGPTGPLDGSRFRLLLGYTSDIKYSNENYYSLITDYRHYFRLSYRTALAARGAIFINEGKNSRRYFGGGSWDLRGWPRWSVRGEKMWLSSVELRFPLLDNIGFNFPFFGLNFTNVRGAIFFDAGSAWDDRYIETLGSLGCGIRVNFFNAIVFRYDFGKKIEDDFKRFQPRWFWQFFFGWDF